MRLPVRFLRGRWPAGLERKIDRFFWNDPRIILSDTVTPDDFRVAMDAIAVGGTIKITAADRHPNADALLIENVRLDDADIVDIGASDGSTSIDLIRKLPGFRSYVIADLFLTVDALNLGGHELFYDHAGNCVLVCGRRLLAWPGRSGFIRFLYAPLLRRARQHYANRRPVLLLNPATRALMADDPRITSAVHDIFDPWPRPAPDVIKVANVLGPYFSDEVISTALQALLDGLTEDGHLLLVDNGQIEGAEPRAGLYRRSDGRFVLVDRTTTLPAIDPLVRAVQSRN